MRFEKTNQVHEQYENQIEKKDLSVSETELREEEKRLGDNYPYL